MKKYLRKHIGKTFTTKESLGGYTAKVVDGGSRSGYCTIQIEDWQTEVQTTHLKKGEIKYPYHPSVHGVGYLGIGNHKASEGGKDTRTYIVWRNMLGRCYNESFQEKYPTYIGCTVHKDWHNFQNFAEWYEESYIEGYELDKDKLSENGIRGKVYGSDTCCFISRAENVEVSQAKTYKFIDPNGEVREIYNLAKFCRENGLSDGTMGSVYNGTRESHKGWMTAEPPVESV